MIKVSVIITTKNEAKHIGNCLQAIKRQTYVSEQIEIVVVDNNSDDATKEIAGKFTDNIYDFGPERSAQRNFGVSKARGKYILYLDADMIISENVVKQCVEKCENDSLIALYIQEKIVNASSQNIDNPDFNMKKQEFWIKVRNFERSFYDATVVDCVRFVKRDAFNNVKGFDEKLTGPEDWDFDRKIKSCGQVGIIDAVLYHNEGRFNFANYLKKKKYYSQSFENYKNKWGKDDPIVKKQLGFSYRFIGVFVENGKGKQLLIHPVLALGMYLLRVFVGIAYILRPR